MALIWLLNVFSVVVMRILVYLSACVCVCTAFLLCGVFVEELFLAWGVSCLGSVVAYLF